MIISEQHQRANKFLKSMYEREYSFTKRYLDMGVNPETPEIKERLVFVNKAKEILAHDDSDCPVIYKECKLHNHDRRN